MLLRSVFAVSLLSLATAAVADSIDINLSDDVAQFQYVAPMGNVGQGKSEFHAGFLYNDSNNALVDAGLLVMSKEDSASDVSVGVGVKVLAARINTNNAVSLALGGQVRYSPSADKKIGVVGQLYFAPDIVTFADADRYIETGVDLEYRVMPQATAYVGYRKVKFGIKTAQDETLDEGAHVGVRVAF